MSPALPFPTWGGGGCSRRPCRGTQTMVGVVRSVRSMTRPTPCTPASLLRPGLARSCIFPIRSSYHGPHSHESRVRSWMTPQDPYDCSWDQFSGSTNSFFPEEEPGPEGGERKKDGAGAPHCAGGGSSRAPAVPGHCSFRRVWAIRA